jgi:hypothetical protein
MRVGPQSRTVSQHDPHVDLEGLCIPLEYQPVMDNCNCCKETYVCETFLFASPTDTMRQSVHSAWEDLVQALPASNIPLMWLLLGSLALKE